MAPEQWQARPDIDGRADVYALGVMLFEMLCGQRPYAAATAYEWIMLHMEATPPDPVQFGVPAQLARLVRRMLSRQPELRPQSMRAVIQDLRTACRGMRSIAAFSGDVNMAAADAPAAATPQSAILSAPTAVVGSAAASPAQAPAPQSYQPQAPAYPSQQQSYQPPQSYPQQVYQPQVAQQAYPPQPYYANQAPVAPPSNRRALLRRVGEIALVVVVFGVYALYNWQEVMTNVRSILQSLKPPI